MALALFVPAFLLGGESNERLKLVYADSLSIETIESQQVQRAWGHVELVQGEAFMKCDLVVNYEKENRANLYGNVILYDGKHRLWADEVVYDGVLRTETATGNVLLISGDRTITGDWLMYDQEKMRAQARGSVHLDDTIEKAVLTGSFVDFDRKVDYGWIEGDPKLTQLDSLENDTLTVTGLKMEVWGSDQHIVVTDSVRILKGDMNGKCDYLEYWPDSSKLVLTGLPVLRQQDQEMTGDTIVIFLKDTRFAGGEIFGSARVVSIDSTSENTLEGKEIFIEAEGDSIREVIVEGQAKGHFFVADEEGGSDEGINSITGDRLVMRFEKNQVVWVRVESKPGQSEGSYIPVDSDTMKIGHGTLKHRQTR